MNMAQSFFRVERTRMSTLPIAPRGQPFSILPCRDALEDGERGTGEERFLAPFQAALIGGGHLFPTLKRRALISLYGAWHSRLTFVKI